MNMQEVYKNKYFSILGDSISTFEGYSQPRYAEFYDLSRKYASGILTPADTWWGNVIERLGGELLVNNSISGSTVCKKRGSEGKACGCSDERTSDLNIDDRLPDVIMVYIGTNDWGGGVKLYPENDAEKEDLSIFSVAYGAMLEKLRKNYPSAEIWCFTLSVSTYTRNENFVFPYCYGGRHIEKYCGVIRACAEEKGCRVIDLHRVCKPFDTIDEWHPNLEGMQTIAEAALRCL